MLERTLSIALVCALLGACTSDQLYATGRNAQRASCMQQPDAAARSRCLQDAGMSHDDYAKQAASARQ